jgi:multicomponent Na+:H+ antiporter subunit C
MTSLMLYTVVGVGLVALGFVSMMTRAHLFWKVLAFNIMGSGTYLVLVAASARLDALQADPVPQAMVLTGIVVTAGATALSLGMILRVVARTGRPFLEEERPAGVEPPSA